MKTENYLSKAAVAVGVIVLVTVSMAASGAQKAVRGTINRNLNIKLTQPTAVTTGDNTFEVVVEGSDGKAINDADVTVSFVMSAWPIKRIPETKSNLALRQAGDGRYNGTWHVTLAGPWQTTVNVKKDGTRIGRKRFVLIAY